jgi:transmembrane sensor
MRTVHTRPDQLTGLTVTEAASYWLVRQDDHTLSPREQQAFEDWCDATPAHREAYERARSMWDGFAQEGDCSEMRALRAAALAVAPLPKRWPRIAAAGFAVVLAATVGITLNSRHTQPSAVTSAASAASDETYSTARNERSTITLSDGTVVTLNRQTTLVVSFTGATRVVRIRQGQAFFEVAKDPQRAFVVQAADQRILALGTQFDVRLDPDKVEVVLLEGRVAIDRDTPSIVDRIAFRNTQVELNPGQRLVARLGESVTVTPTDAQRATSWRQGWVVFENETLSAAVAELNRYSDRPITATDEAVRDLRLSGVFRIGQPERFIAIIQEALPVRSIQDAQGGTRLVAAPIAPTAEH